MSQAPDSPQPATPTDKQIDTSNLGQTMRRGATYSAFALVTVQLVGFVQILVLARTLSPEEVGVFAAGMAVSVFLLVFVESGLSHALVQRPEHDIEEASNTIFWATLAVGLTCSLVALAAAPLVASAFGSGIAGAVAAAASGTVLLQAFTNVPDYLMQRRFNFRRRLIVDPSVAISHAVVAITFSALGFGVWSLVLGAYASVTAWVISTWCLCRWRPGLARPSWKMLSSVLRFTMPLLISGIGIKARDLIETVVVGRYLDTIALGQYRYGRRLALLPGLAIVQISSYLLFPAFARIADDVARFRRGYLKALGLLWFTVVPATALLVAIGEPMVVLLLGERWRGAGIALVAMAGHGLGEAMGSVGQETILGSGRSSRLNAVTASTFVTGVLLLLLLVPFGLVGVGLSISIASIISGITSLALSRKLAGVSVSELLRCLLPVLAAGLAALAAIGYLEHQVVHSDRLGTGMGLGILVAETLAFALIYLVMIRLIAPSLSRSLIEAARSTLKSRRVAAPFQL